MAKGWLIALIVLGVAGVALLCVGGGLTVYFRSKVHSTVEENVVLTNGSEAYKAWQDPPAPVYLDFYFFDVLNPEEVINGSKPRVRQLGPYCYRELKEKKGIKFLNGTARIQYNETKQYIFNETLSAGSELDNITNIDLFSITLATRFRYQSKFNQWLLKFIFRTFDQSLFETHTVHDWLWGYRPKLLRELRKRFGNLVPDIKVGLYVKNNKTGDDEYTISSGTQNIDNLGDVFTWKGDDHLDYWTTNYSNMINGTDGSMWHPFVSRSEKLYVFNTDVCRSVYITYSKDSSVSPSSIPVLQFTAPPELFATPSVNPDNAGFCTPKGNCMEAGVLNISVCRDGSPVIMSLPHFLYANETYQDAIDGIKPNKSLHTTLIDVEPTTGVVLNAAKKLQINLYVEKNLNTFDQTAKLETDFVFPLAWIDEHGEISDEDAAKFKDKVLSPMREAEILQYTLMAVGALFILIVLILVIILAIRHRLKREDPLDDPLITDA